MACALCNRSREELIRRGVGFDHLTSTCAACDAPSDGEGDDETCQGCSANLCEWPSDIDGYCKSVCDAYVRL